MARMFDLDKPLLAITEDELDRKLQEHKVWLDSGKQGGSRADFQIRKFPDHVDLSEANLIEADLSGADLSAADLFQANLSGAKLISANLSGAKLHSANLNGAKLQSANLCVAKLLIANLQGADLRKANLNSADLFEADLSDARLQNANLKGVDLRKSILRGADLSEADLSGADLRDADLSGANLSSANLSGANLSGANLINARLRSANLANADLRNTEGLRLSANLIRDAHFSLVCSRSRALLRNHVFPFLRQHSQRRGWTWLSRQFDFRAQHSDPWSVLRQMYAGPRMFFLLLFLVSFAVPYVGRAVWWGSVSRVEPQLLRATEKETEELQVNLAKAKVELADVMRTQQELTTQRQKVFAVTDKLSLPTVQKVIEDNREAERKFLMLQHFLETSIDRWQVRLKHLELGLKENMEERSVLSVILHWDRGWLPTFLACLLMLYNVLVYHLITRVGALRDQEERSGYSPEWNNYLQLIWIHRVVTCLFYVSLGSLIWNVLDMLGSTVYLPNSTNI